MALGVPFGNYRLVRRIARGGMAEVFLAWQLSASLTEGAQEEGRRTAPEGFYDTTTGIRFVRQVAVKRILPHLSESEEFRALFLQEARLAATLSHPNVVHIYDFGRTGDCLFLAMELIEGLSLLSLMESAPAPAPLPIEYAVRIAADALGGLHHAHTRTDALGRPLHIVHRDVSPQNLMITWDGVVKVLDFGIAKAAWSAQETRPGVIRGKYGYMSPEQAEGQRLDGRSDLYAVGICLFELLAGVPLVPRGLPVEAALRAVRSGNAVGSIGQLELLRPDVPADLLSVLVRAVQPRREHRYESAAEMQLDLERFLKEWPRLSSPVLLGEYLRRYAGRTDLVPLGAMGPGEVTPVVQLGGTESGLGTGLALAPPPSAGEEEVDGLQDTTLVESRHAKSRLAALVPTTLVPMLAPTLAPSAVLDDDTLRHRVPAARQGGVESATVLTSVLETVVSRASEQTGRHSPPTGVVGLRAAQKTASMPASFRLPPWALLGGGGVLFVLLVLLLRQCP